jgi:hypothetical protein
LKLNVEASVVRTSLGLALLAGACVGVQPPVPVSGDVASLTGEWEGTYSSAQSGRRGNIFFRLEAGRDTARGDIVMYPVGYPVATAPWDPSNPADPNRPSAEVLTITFVQAVAGTVTGRLDPYRDPQCGCSLTTTFIGKLQGDTLSGTFTSWHQEMQKRVEGEWNALRKSVRSKQ